MNLRAMITEGARIPRGAAAAARLGRLGFERRLHVVEKFGNLEGG